VVGKVLEKETGGGVPYIIVELFLLAATAEVTTGLEAGSSDASAVELLKLVAGATKVASTITDSQGGFAFATVAPTAGEPRQALILVLLAPDEPGLALTDRVLHVASDPRGTSSQEGYVFRLPADLLAKHSLPAGAFSASAPVAADRRLSAYVQAQQDDLAFADGVAQFHAEQIQADSAARSAFRTDLLSRVRSDLSALSTGAVVSDAVSIADAHAHVVEAGLIAANAALAPGQTGGVPVNLYLSPDDLTRLAPEFQAASGGIAVLSDSDLGDILFRTDSSENPGALLIHENPIDAYLSQDSPDVLCAKEHAGMASSAPAGSPNGNPGGDPGTVPEQAVSPGDVPRFVGRLINEMQAPDLVTRPDLFGKRADQEKLAADVTALSLPKGPAELPATYYFSSLQIAFDHVWQQLFDEQIPNLAYTANVLGKSRLGIPDFVSSAIFSGTLRPDVLYTVPPLEVPTTILQLFDITRDQYNDMAAPVRDQLLAIAKKIQSRYDSADLTVTVVGRTVGGSLAGMLGITTPATTSVHSGVTVADMRTVQVLLDQGQRLIDSVQQDDNSLNVTLQQLAARLSGSYEFTVFGADKDYHSVNFGLLTTYQQQWTPVAIQPGRMVRTIPLSPREEQKYTVKRHRTKMRTGKETRKETSSITNDSTSTDRVDADIVTKATTTTDFKMTMSGDYSIGIAKGSGDRSFGVNAVRDSTETRKDFHEAVVKAAEEYKSEMSTEIATETEMSVDFETSGTIVNPNAELAVTYLFYELQKRFRISERIYRVLPVVLVAQEVPAPDQITPAWVIAHDWILQRVLLDDSFRPTLAYLANNSVGDDYGIRELRRNLRQQRLLVETLRIEFSAASTEADNRYTALERTIARTLGVEQASDTEGVAGDVLSGIFGGGPDPDTARAREAAAKDAHQYAQEKADKINQALMQEMANLHALTDAYTAAMQKRLNDESRVERLLAHLRDFILYYMQAIWSMEPPDQRYLRLCNTRVPVIELDSRLYRVETAASPDIFAHFRPAGTEKHRAHMQGQLKHNAGGGFDTVALVDIADLDNLQGFMGNYMIFPLAEHNALTQFMAAPYVDSAFGAMDPDELANVGLEQYSRYVCALHDQLGEQDFDAIKPELKAWLEQILAAPTRTGDEIVVPSGGLFIEALVDQNPVLEDYMLMQRHLDVLKVEGEARRIELDNLLRAGRLLNGERSDPTVEKKILIEGAAPSVLVGGD
jgi:hypothetical protein